MKKLELMTRKNGLMNSTKQFQDNGSKLQKIDFFLDTVIKIVYD